MDEKQGTTISVMEMGQILGLKKTDAYWLVHKQCFETVTVGGKMRIVLKSFEHWYANQVKHKKIDGTPPGQELRANSYSIKEMAEELGVAEGVAYDIIKRYDIETFKVDTWKRVRKDVFDAWYRTQSRYRTRKDREKDAEHPGLKVDENKAAFTLQEAAVLLDLTYNEMRSLIRSGDLEAKKYGTRYLIPRDEIRWFLLQQRLEREI